MKLNMCHEKLCFKQDVEATVNLRYVTSGSLKTSRRDFDPESGQINLSLGIPDERWQPRTGLDKWNSSSRTFVEVIEQRGVLSI